MVHAGPVSSYAFKRLELLAARFSLHILLNDTRELDAQKSVPHRDFYNVRKVDTRECPSHRLHFHFHLHLHPLRHAE